MGEPNIFVSNGTCYSAPGKKLDSSFIPCGNAAFGHYTCCGAGDNCLFDNACWGVHGTGYGSSLTYMAGCTDPDYKDPSCPRKEFDQPWIALTHCDESKGAWAPCSQQGNPTTLQPGSYCSCTDASKTTIAFKDTPELTSIGSLPRSTGESIQFFAGHFPTTPAAPGTGGQGSNPSSGASTGGSSVATTGTGSGSSSGSSLGSGSGSGLGSGSGSVSNTASSPSQTGQSPSNEGTNTSSGLSSGTKIAIGVGVSVGVLILLAAIVALFILRRRGQRRSSGVGNGSVTDSKTSKSRVSGASTSPNMPEADGRPVSEADGKAARPWSMRSELEGSQVPLSQSKPGHGGIVGSGEKYPKDSNLHPLAELPGSNGWRKGVEMPNNGRNE